MEKNINSPFPYQRGLDVNKLFQNRGVFIPPELAINLNNTKQYVLN